MYIPDPFAETDVAVLHALIQQHPLGSWVTLLNGTLNANHIPFVLDPSRGKYGTLMGHVARANPISQLQYPQVDSLIIFQGAECYISPSWYANKATDGKVTPTWNYAVVHAQGQPVMINDPAWLLAHLHQLTDTHEASQPQPWRVTDAPEEYISRLVDKIVGVEIPIDTLVGKWKISQNRPAIDTPTIVSALEAMNTKQTTEMAMLMKTHKNIP